MSYGGPPYSPPPYGTGPSPTFGYGQGHAPSFPRQSFFQQHPMMAIRLAIVACVLPLGIGGGLWAVHEQNKNKVLLDCGTSAVHVFVDGDDVAALEPLGHKVVAVTGGPHVLEARDASGNVVEKASISLPKKRFRGVFRFANARPVVLVSEIYGTAPNAIAQATPVVKTVPDGPFAGLPDDTDLASLDTAFLDSIQMNQHESYRVVWKVCHLNRGRHGPAQVGCPKAPLPEDEP